MNKRVYLLFICLSVLLVQNIFAQKNLLTNFITKPDFIAYHYKYKDCLPLKICRRFYKIPIYGWTFRDKKAYKENEPYFEGFIFEKFVKIVVKNTKISYNYSIYFL